MLVRYKGEDRHGYRPGRVATRDNRISVPHNAPCKLLKRDHAGNLVETLVAGKRVHFMCPSWQLRKLVKK